jgi:hypothetical protein
LGKGLTWKFIIAQLAKKLLGFHGTTTLYSQYCTSFIYSIERIVLLDFIHCLVSQKNWGIKYIYQKNHNTHFQNSHKVQLLTTEPLTWVHTQHKPLKQVRHRWQEMTQPLHTSQLLKPGKHKYRIQTKAHGHPHTPWNTRSQGKNPGGN